MKKTFNNLSVKAKIMMNSLFLLFIILGISLYSLFTMRSIGSELSSIAVNDIPLTKMVTAITEYQLEQAIHFERVSRLAVINQKDPNIKLEVGLFDKLSNKATQELKLAEKLAQVTVSNSNIQNEKDKFAQVLQQLLAIEKAHHEYEDDAHIVFQLLERNDIERALKSTVKVEHEQEQLIHELESLLSDIAKFTEMAAITAQKHEESAEYLLIIIVFISIILAILSSAWLSNRIVSDIKSATKIASGNLNSEIKVNSNDEIGELLSAMNGMRSKLLNMIDEIGDTTAQLSTAADEIAVISEQSSNSIHQQQLQTEQISTAMNEMNASVIDVANNITQTSTASKEASSETDKGRTVVKNAVKGIEDLAIKVEAATAVITKVEEDSENINTVLDVIKGIADQTNLLALNAAIEAARAGEQGRGFAVVADEVRTLAGRTQNSTVEINNIIEQLQLGARDAATAMRESQEQSLKVVKNAKLTNSSLNEISNSVSQIDEMSDHISSSAQEQIVVTEEMNKNIVHINDMAGENAEGATQTSKASKELAEMASRLQDIILQFRK